MIESAWTERPRTVLFVDDDPFILAVARGMLEGSPYRALTSSEPAAALQVVGPEQVDIVVSDVSMPGADGIDFVVELRRRHPDVVRILLTTGTSFAESVRAVNEGQVLRLLQKPIEPAALLEALHAGAVWRAEAARADAQRRAGERRMTGLARLEALHPGISTRPLEDGVYVVSAAREQALRTLLAGGPLSALLP